MGKVDPGDQVSISISDKTGGVGTLPDALYLASKLIRLGKL